MSVGKVTGSDSAHTVLALLLDVSSCVLLTMVLLALVTVFQTLSVMTDIYGLSEILWLGSKHLLLMLYRY